MHVAKKQACLAHIEELFNEYADASLSVVNDASTAFFAHGHSMSERQSYVLLIEDTYPS